MSIYTGKTAVVTGGTHGMGLAVAHKLLAGGAEVMVTGRNERNIENARATLGPRARVVRSDAAGMTDIQALGKAAEDAFGRIDALFVNAGIADLKPFDQVTEDAYDRMFAVNAKGAYFTVARLAPVLRDGGAVVFTTVTGGGGGGTPDMSVYLGSKAALWAFAQGFAAELLPRGIRVNAVAPGFIDTPTMGIADASPEERAALQATGDEITPMRRHGTSDEVADAALFLAFDATYTTGVQLPVDGGLSTGVVHPAT